MSEERVTAAQDFVRFRRSVRLRIRQHVRREKAAPPLTLWCSQGENPRKLHAVPVGAAVGPVEVRENVVAGIRLHESRFAAIGRLLYMRPAQSEEEPEMTTVYGLVVACAERVEGWEAAIVNGRVDVWEPSRIGDGREGPDHAWFWLNQAIRGARR